MPALLSPTPRTAAVFREQVRTVALSLRPEAVAAAVLLAGWWLRTVMDARPGEGEIWVAPAVFWPLVVAALVLPLSVWRGESPDERGYHRAMPVGARTHALARCAAGLVWVLGLGCAYFAWMLALGKATGGGLRTGPGAWRWIAPPTAILCTYLLGSAIALVSGRAWLWGMGAIGYLVLAVSMGDGEGFVGRGVGALFSPVSGRFGLIGLATGWVPLATNVNRVTFIDWLPVAWPWLSVSVAAFGAALWRQEG